MECYYSVWREGRPTGTTIGRDQEASLRYVLAVTKPGLCLLGENSAVWVIGGRGPLSPNSTVRGTWMWDRTFCERNGVQIKRTCEMEISHVLFIGLHFVRA